MRADPAPGAAGGLLRNGRMLVFHEPSVFLTIAEIRTGASKDAKKAIYQGYLALEGTASVGEGRHAQTPEKKGKKAVFLTIP